MAIIIVVLVYRHMDLDGALLGLDVELDLFYSVQRLIAVARYCEDGKGQVLLLLVRVQDDVLRDGLLRRSRPKQ